jgi:hypothetical protein
VNTSARIRRPGGSRFISPMVITIATDRRTPLLADVAVRLAEAMALTVVPDASPREIGLVLPRILRARVRTDVDVVALPERAVAAEVAAALRAITARHRVTVVAWGGMPTEQALAICDASDRVLVLSQCSVSSLRGAQRLLKLCASLGYGMEKVAVVLHGFSDDAPVAPTDAANALKREIVGVIPDSAAGESGRARAFEGLAQRLAGRVQS